MITPSRNGSVTGNCIVCGPPTHRPSSSYLQRRLLPKVLAPTPSTANDFARSVAPARSFTQARDVYECPACEANQIGEQRCECGSFVRRLGEPALGLSPDRRRVQARGERLSHHRSQRAFSDRPLD